MLGPQGPTLSKLLEKHYEETESICNLFEVNKPNKAQKQIQFPALEAESEQATTEQETQPSTNQIEPATTVQTRSGRQVRAPKRLDL